MYVIYWRAWHILIYIQCTYLHVYMYYNNLITVSVYMHSSADDFFEMLHGIAALNMIIYNIDEDLTSSVIYEIM